MRTGHLFAGSGGGLLADRILGHTPVFAVEWDRECCQTLRDAAATGWYPGLRVHEGDISLWNPSEYAGRVDSINAGFPCTDISVAGNGEGIDGDKSGLWSEVARVAGVLRPRELFLENSPAIFNRGLDRVLSDLAALGYDARWICLSASAVGAPHERDRWWCLANARSGRLGKSGEGEDKQPGRAETFGASEDVSNAHGLRGRDNKARGFRGDSREKQADIQQKNGEPHAGYSKPIRRHVAHADNKGAIRTISGKTERAGVGCGDWWATEPNMGRVAHGVANRADRIKALGNGQVPLQAAMAYKLLKGGL